MTIRQLIARTYAILEILFLGLVGIWWEATRFYKQYGVDGVVLFLAIVFLVVTFIIALINC